MSEGVRGVVIGHGGMAAALVAAAEEISGIRGVLRPISNVGLGKEALEHAVLQAVDQQPAVIFVDLPSGSCLIAAMRQRPAHPELRVVTGVNLAMLLEFLFHHELSPEEVARRAAEAGTKGIGAR